MKITPNEASKQFERIWEQHHDPEFQQRKKSKELREKRKEDYKEDLGLK